MTAAAHTDTSQILQRARNALVNDETTRNHKIAEKMTRAQILVHPLPPRGKSVTVTVTIQESAGRPDERQSKKSKLTTTVATLLLKSIWHNFGWQQQRMVGHRRNGVLSWLFVSVKKLAILFYQKLITTHLLLRRQSSSWEKGSKNRKILRTTSRIWGPEGERRRKQQNGLKRHCHPCSSRRTTAVLQLG